jgi:hypothetical protein
LLAEAVMSLPDNKFNRPVKPKTLKVTLLLTEDSVKGKTTLDHACRGGPFDVAESCECATGKFGSAYNLIYPVFETDG